MNTKITLTKKQEGLYPKLASELQGVCVDINKWEEGRSFSDQLLKQSHDIASKMESVGYTAYDYNQDLTIIGLHSQQATKLPPFRNITIIPWVARKKRNSSAKELEYFLQKNPNARTWVHTTGPRCNIFELPKRLKKLHAKFGRVNHQPFMQKHGARFVFRSTEFGEIAKTNEGLSFHPHAHSVLVLDKKLDNKAWCELVSSIRKFFVYHSKDCGVIKSVKELVKYCVKPSDLESLDGHDLVSLHQVTKGKRLVEFLSYLRSQRQNHKANDQKLVRRKGLLRRTDNWSVGKKKKPKWQLPIYDDDSVVRPTIVAWCPPSAIFMPVTEPCFIVHGLGNQDHQTILNSFEVQNMRSAIKVHTKTLTHHTQNKKYKQHHENQATTIQTNLQAQRIPISSKISHAII